MKIGIYFNSKHLQNWTWKDFIDREIPLSGTDSQVLFLAYNLAVHGCDVFFFSAQQPTTIDCIQHIQVVNLQSAVIAAKELNLDILIFTNRGDQETISGVEQSSLSQQKCIVWDHNGPSYEMGQLFANSDLIRRVICVSASQADCFRDQSVFSKMEFVYNSSYAISKPITTKSSYSTLKPLKVCYVGSLTPSKGFQHLAKAWGYVHSIFPEAILEVIGSAKLYDRTVELGPLNIADPIFESSYIIPYLGKTREEAKTKGVNFLGLVKPSQMLDILSSCSLGVVNPNCTGSLETFCVSAIDIQASATPVIGANREGLKETVKDGVTGVLINREKDLSKVITNLLSDKKRLDSMGKNASEWVSSKFTSEVIIFRWLSVLESVIKGENAINPSFSFQRTKPQNSIREMIRLSKKIPFLGRSIPDLKSVKNFGFQNK